MREPALVLHPTDEMPDAMQRLLRVRTSGAPVVHADGTLVGILSDKDCIRTAANWAMENVQGGTVGDYMSPVKTVLSPENDIFAAASIFLGNHFVVLPVIEGDRLVGELHRRELLRGILGWMRANDRAHTPAPSDSMDRATSIAGMQRQFANQSREQLASVYGHRRK